MATNTDFLRFSAYSIKDLITRKLAQDSNFTDQVYEGSNLAVLIDIFSYMAQCILYSLNNAAAESMFSDTQIYENMNRLVNFIGYNPSGCQPSNMLFKIDTKNLRGEKSLLKYSYINTDMTDANGNPIYFSTDQNINITKNNNTVLMYNGRWMKYSTIFISSGEPYQKFILTGLRSSSEDDMMVAQNKVHVYVKSEDGKYTTYKCVTEGLFTDNNITNGTYVYSNQTGDIFNLRLNENKTYEITFGNGRNGNIPKKDSQIIIYYLKSNNVDSFSTILPNSIVDKTYNHSPATFGMDDTEYKAFFGNDTDNKLDNDSENGYKFVNITESSKALPEETVDEIRLNAPEWFKTGNRLVTESDYMYYIKNRFSDNVIDAKCQNNWQYITTFYKWLYELGLNGRYIFFNKRNASDSYYINQTRIVKYDYRYSDASDSNNVYLWIKMRNSSDIYTSVIDNELQPVKMLTQEIVYLKPIHVYFAPCASELEEAFNELQSDDIFNGENHSYIELTVNDDIMYTNTDIQIKAAQIIRDYFNEEKCRLGQTVDLSEITSKILNDTGIQKIRTVYNDGNGTIKIINGLSFASWSADYIDRGEDLDISNVTKTLELFQFPKLYNGNNLEAQIKVIRKTINNINITQF